MLTSAAKSERLQRSAQGAEHVAHHATFIPCNVLCISAGEAHHCQSYHTALFVISHAGVIGNNPPCKSGIEYAVLGAWLGCAMAHTDRHAQTTFYAHTNPTFCTHCKLCHCHGCYATSLGTSPPTPGMMNRMSNGKELHMGIEWPRHQLVKHATTSLPPPACHHQPATSTCTHRALQPATCGHCSAQNPMVPTPKSSKT
jgi:hypothetical protein